MPLRTETTSNNSGERGVLSNSKRSLALFLAGVVSGATVGYGISAETTQTKPHSLEATPAPSASAQQLEEALNSKDKVTSKVTIERGSVLPLNRPDGAVAIIHPIKFDKDTYGFIAIDQDSGEATVETVEYDGELIQSYVGGHNKAYPQEVEASLALVYNDTDAGITPTVTRFYSVIMSETAGDTDSFLQVPEGLNNDEQNRIVNQQMGELSEERVGELLYEGK